jgi:hypothetical protein
MLERFKGGGHDQQIRSFLPDIPQEGVDRLVRSLDRTETGFDRDLRTPFMDGASREEIASDLERRIGLPEFGELVEIDAHERGKLGPLSIMLPYAERRADVLKYGEQSFLGDEAALDQASDRVSTLIQSASLRVASFQTAWALMPKDTSLGLPWVTRDKQLAEHYLHRATHLTDPDEIYPAILYWRGQAAGPNKTKQRVVWGFDHAETIFGATILYPVLSKLRTLAGFSAWLGDVFVDEAITQLIKQAANRRIISMDYSGFDSSLHLQVLSRVDRVLANWFASPGPDRVSLLSSVSNEIPIVVPWKLELEGRMGGMPSGSVLTNLRDTLANLIAGEYASIRSNNPLIRYELLGDDSVFVFDKDMDPADLSALVGELGLESNPEKQFVSRTAAHFLQRWHSQEYVKDGLYRGVRSPYRALAGILGYERFRSGWNKYMDTARWIMQFENLKNHPKFGECVRFLRDGDDVLRSGMDPITVFKFAGGADVIRSTLNIASFPFNVQNPDLVGEFETTKLLRDLG